MQATSSLSIYVNGEKLTANKDDNLLELLKENGFEIPTLCYHKGLPSYGACRLCSVEIKEGQRSRIVTSCTYPVRDEGIEVFTQSSAVNELRKIIIQFLLSRTPSSDRIKELAGYYDVKKEDRFIEEEEEEADEKCILCGLCVRVCNDMLQKNAISFVSRGIDRKVAPPFEEPPEECIGCEACSFVCPTGAIVTKIQDNKKYIEPWGALLEVAWCGECNKSYMTDETIREAKNRAEVENDNALVCPECKRKHTVKNLKESKSPFFKFGL